jgi:hypothetical protein
MNALWAVLAAVCTTACATSSDLRDAADANERLAIEWRRNDNPDLDAYFSRRAAALRKQADAIPLAEDVLNNLAQGLFDALIGDPPKPGQRKP